MKSLTMKLPVKELAREPLLGIPIPHGASGIEKRLSVIRRQCRFEGSRVLDVGCGNGAYTLVLSGCFFQVHGIDIESLRLQDLQQHVVSKGFEDIHVYRMSVEHMAFADCSSDVVTAIEVIEHLVYLKLGTVQQ